MYRREAGLESGPEWRRSPRHGGSHPGPQIVPEARNLADTGGISGRPRPRRSGRDTRDVRRVTRRRNLHSTHRKVSACMEMRRVVGCVGCFDNNILDFECRE
jgi:hypothetical protein